jgi:hypothetical protein
LSDEVLHHRAVALRLVAANMVAALPDIDRLVGQAEEALRRTRAAAPDILALLAAGALLHAFYNEIEKVFRLLAERLDAFEPAGEDWRARLADQMFVPVPSLRPAPLPESLRDATRDYRAFRHLFRHLYSFDLDAGRVSGLLQRLGGYWREARSALLDFARALEQIAEGIEGGPLGAK